MRRVTDVERRARLAKRHALAPAFRVDQPEDAVRAMTVFHATEAATPYLSFWARSRSGEIAAMDQALYQKRTLVKQLAMRRTLFVFPRDLLPASWASASARVAETERARIVKHVEKNRIINNGDTWLKRVRREVLAALMQHPHGLSTLKLRELVPLLRPQEKLSGSVGPSIASQVLTYLGARADIVRGENKGAWKTARTPWTLPENWLGDATEPCKAADGYRELVRRWLHTFGPGTEEDIVWWLGATKNVVRTTLSDLDAVKVSLDDGDLGWLLPEDLEEVADPGPWVALLPILDPTVMGWRKRDFYLPCHKNRLFDRAGNAGTTAWVNGRVVGCWVQSATGRVELRLLEDVTGHARRALNAEALRLTEWLNGTMLSTSLRIPAMIQGSFSSTRTAALLLS